MAAAYLSRRERLLPALNENNVDALLVTGEVNVRYLTGFTGDSTYLILGANNSTIISDGRYDTQLAYECPDLERFIRPPKTSLPEATGEVLEKLGFKSVEFDGNNLTVAQFTTLQEKAANVDWKPHTGRVEDLRAVKDETELEQIKSAIAMAERAFAMFRAMLRGKESEKSLADDLEMYIRRAGGECSSFPPIVASGPRAALPHARPTEHQLGGEDVLLVDWGAVAGGYKSDLTRVLVRRRKATSSPQPQLDEELRRAYDVVLRAQQSAIQKLRPGAKASDIDAAARTVIEEAGYGERFTHSIGHGIGLDIHEAPLMKPASNVEIQAGMVVTVEPGIYIPGRFGVRIEDDVLVTPDGPLVLTAVPKDFDAQLIEWF